MYPVHECVPSITFARSFKNLWPSHRYIKLIFSLFKIIKYDLKLEAEILYALQK